MFELASNNLPDSKLLFPIPFDAPKGAASQAGEQQGNLTSKDPEYGTQVGAFLIPDSELSEDPAFPISALPELGMEGQHATQITYKRTSSMEEADTEDHMVQANLKCPFYTEKCKATEMENSCRAKDWG